MRNMIIREVANILNGMGHPCCRCMDCETCKKATEIYDKVMELQNPMNSVPEPKNSLS